VNGDVLSEDGRLLKLINTSRARHHVQPVVVEVLQLFTRPIVHIHVQPVRHGGREHAKEGREPMQKMLVVASRNDVMLLPLQRCHRQSSCRQARLFVVPVRAFEE